MTARPFRTLIVLNPEHIPYLTDFKKDLEDAKKFLKPFMEWEYSFAYGKWGAVDFEINPTKGKFTPTAKWYNDNITPLIDRENYYDTVHLCLEWETEWEVNQIALGWMHGRFIKGAVAITCGIDEDLWYGNYMKESPYVNIHEISHAIVFLLEQRLNIFIQDRTHEFLYQMKENYEYLKPYIDQYLTFNFDSMLELVRLEGDSKVFCVKNGFRYWIFDWAMFQAGLKVGVWKGADTVKAINKVAFDSLKDGGTFFFIGK